MITKRQNEILKILNKKGELTPIEIYREYPADLTRQQVHGTIAKLVKLGLITTRMDDKKKMRVSITDKGRQLVV